MIVEILGPTSSGKSTIARALIAHSKLAGLSAVPKVVRAEPEQRSLMKLLGVDLLALICFFCSVKSVSYCYQLLQVSLSREDKLFMRINLFRNFIKKQGQNWWFRTHSRSNIVIFDEGSIHSFSNLFSHYNASPNLDQVKILKGEILFPDVLVLIETPCETMIERAKKRKNPPWLGLSVEQWNNIFRSTQQVYHTILTSQCSIPKIHINSNEYDPAALYQELVKLFRGPKG